jgi:hypothetical protein
MNGTFHDLRDAIRQQLRNAPGSTPNSARLGEATESVALLPGAPGAVWLP